MKYDALTSAVHSHDRNHNVQQLHVFIGTDTVIAIWNHNTAIRLLQKLLSVETVQLF